MSDKYILGGEDGHTPIECPDPLTWGRWLEDNPELRTVKQEYIGPYYISTIFLGLDQNHHALFFGKEHMPILFETMAFVNVGHSNQLEIQERCATWEEAEAQHERIAAEFRKAQNG